MRLLSPSEGTSSRAPKGALLRKGTGGLRNTDLPELRNKRPQTRPCQAIGPACSEPLIKAARYTPGKGNAASGTGLMSPLTR
jgi:hypothetical protein